MKDNKSFFLIFLFSLFIIIGLSVCFANTNNNNCQSSQQPQWVLTFLYDKKHYYGINSAEFRGIKPDYQTIQQAKDRAIKDLSYAFQLISNHIIKNNYQHTKMKK